MIYLEKSSPFFDISIMLVGFQNDYQASNHFEIVHAAWNGERLCGS